MPYFKPIVLPRGGLTLGLGMVPQGLGLSEGTTASLGNPPDVTIRFDHLEPIHRQIRLPGLSRALDLRCKFSNHTFSEAVKPGMAALGREFEIQDGKRLRQYSVERHHLSHQLPGMVQDLISNPEIYVNGTTHHNFVYVVDLHNVSGQEKYGMFFSMKKSEGSNRVDVEMFVESAYSFVAIGNPQANILGRIKFGNVVLKKFQRQEVRVDRVRARFR
jgi:hypothetical protein